MRCHSIGIGINLCDSPAENREVHMYAMSNFYIFRLKINFRHVYFSHLVKTIFQLNCQMAQSN